MNVSMSYESENRVFYFCVFLLFFFTVNIIANKNPCKRPRKTIGLPLDIECPSVLFRSTNAVAYHSTQYAEIIKFIHKMASDEGP